MKRYLRYVLPAGGSFIAMAAFGFQCIAGPAPRLVGAEVFTVGGKPVDMAAVGHVRTGYSLTNALLAAVDPNPARAIRGYVPAASPTKTLLATVGYNPADMAAAGHVRTGSLPDALFTTAHHNPRDMAVAAHVLTGSLTHTLLATTGHNPADMAAATHVLTGSLTATDHTPTADTSSTPPPTWQEHWFEHRQEMRRVFSNTSISVYYDKETPETITWPDTLLTKVWNYTTQTYGAFGKDNRLFVLLHTGKYAGGHPSTYFDRSHDYRNVIDVGHAGDWISPTGWNLDAAVHEVGHIVEGASKGVHGSPAFPIWKDSKWMEIYQYDVYRALGWDAEAQRWFNMQMKGTDNFPRPGTQWFKNWFYPLYHQYGGVQVLNNFFTLLATNFPRNGNAYTRDMNWGEFIHFWSGAAGVNLKPQATIAFGWPDEWEAQFRQAQKDFPNVQYK